MTVYAPKIEPFTWEQPVTAPATDMVGPKAALIVFALRGRRSAWKMCKGAIDHVMGFAARDANDDKLATHECAIRTVPGARRRGWRAESNEEHQHREGQCQHSAR